MSAFVANWLVPIASLIAAIGTTIWAVRNGHPEAVWFYCDMLNLCGNTP